MTLREIDALVARHVMGWRNYKSISTDLIYFLPPAALESEYMQGQVRVVDERDDENNAPSFTEDIAAAWTIVDHLKRTRKAAFVMGCNGCASQISVWFNDGIWALAKQQNSVPSPNDPHLLGGATAETAPLAICKAALRVAGIDPDTGEKL